jgi:hypothetical protein
MITKGCNRPELMLDVDEYLSEEYSRWKGVALKTII